MIPTPLATLPALLLIPVLLYASLCDLRGMRVPVRVWVPWYAIAGPVLVGVVILWSSVLEVMVIAAAITMAVLITVVGDWLHVETIGMGDVIALAAVIPAIAVFTEITTFLISLAFLAVAVSIPAALLRKRDTVPLVPFITVAVGVTFISALV